MKIRIAFAALALLAVASAFTARNKTNFHYKILADDSANNRWQVENVSRTPGAGEGQYTCSSSGDCAVNTVDITPTQIGSLYFINKSDGTLTNGVYSVNE
jgi:hypothetical protein